MLYKDNAEAPSEFGRNYKNKLVLFAFVLAYSYLYVVPP